MRVAAFYLGSQAFHASTNLGDLYFAALAGEFLIGATVDKDEAPRNGLVRARINESVLEHSVAVVFAGQSGVSFPPSALLDGQEAGLLPVQLVGVGVVDCLIIIPAHGR